MANQKQSFKLDKLAKAILAKRTKDDLSFRAIETKTGISKATLQRIEAGALMPSAASLGEICTWLELPVNNFF